MQPLCRQCTSTCGFMVPVQLDRCYRRFCLEGVSLCCEREGITVSDNLPNSLRLGCSIVSNGKYRGFPVLERSRPATATTSHECCTHPGRRYSKSSPPLKTLITLAHRLRPSQQLAVDSVAGRVESTAVFSYRSAAKKRIDSQLVHGRARNEIRKLVSRHSDRGKPELAFRELGAIEDKCKRRFGRPQR